MCNVQEVKRSVIDRQCQVLCDNSRLKTFFNLPQGIGVQSFGVDHSAIKADFKGSSDDSRAKASEFPGK